MQLKVSQIPLVVKASQKGLFPIIPEFRSSFDAFWLSACAKEPPNSAAPLIAFAIGLLSQAS